MKAERKPGSAFRNYKDETPFEQYKRGTAEQDRTRVVRRRIEDVKMGLELDREAFAEVWDD